MVVCRSGQEADAGTALVSNNTISNINGPVNPGHFFYKVIYLCRVIFSTADVQLFKLKALSWADQFDTVCYLDGNGYTDPYGKYEAIIAVGAKACLEANAGSAFEQLIQFRRDHPGFLTGFIGYDLKNEVEDLSSKNADGLVFPDLYFFSPETVIIITADTIDITGENAADIYGTIERIEVSAANKPHNVNLLKRFTKDDYINTVNEIKARIARGDIYVTNFCQEFYAQQAVVDPLSIYQQLSKLSPTPFSSYLKWKGNYVMCASPERFLAKRGNKLISQPIKGTAPRSADPQIDLENIRALQNHPKELQENVMVVDMVRNDLTKSATPGTVVTEELFGIYSFKQVHQMISTVTCEIREDLDPVEAIKNTFPMGSMTGAPKVSAMRLMEHYERSKRGVYSGAIGYFASDGDFDFNVVIRSLLYNATNKYLSFQVGSAITYHADAAKEYEECLLKAKAIFEVLGVSS